MLFLASARRACSANASRRRHERAPRVPAAAALRRLAALCSATPSTRCSRCAVACAAVVKTDGYFANILMQAATYAIAVFGLSVVLGLCGQINLAQAAFFGSAPMRSASAPSDYNAPFWLCLAAGMAVALRLGRAARPVDACGSAGITSRW